MNDASATPYIPTQAQIETAHHEGMKAGAAGHAPTHNPYFFGYGPEQLQQAWSEGQALVAAFAERKVQIYQDKMAELESLAPR